MLKGGYTSEAYYVGSVQEFREDARLPCLISDHLESIHNEVLGKDLPRINLAQKNAWASSVVFLDKLLGQTDLDEEQLVIFEPVIGNTRERVDVLFCGRNIEGVDNVTILELKTWHTRNKDYRHYDITHRNAFRGDTRLNVSLISRQFSDGIFQLDGESENPRLQARRYARSIRDLLRNKGENALPLITAAAVLYNCKKLSKRFKKALEFNVHPETTRYYPIFTKDGCDGSFPLQILAEKLESKLEGGGGWDVYERLKPALHSIES